MSGFRVNDEVLVTGVLHREEREQHRPPAAPREMIGKIVEAHPDEFLYLVYFFDGTDEFDGWYPEVSIRLKESFGWEGLGNDVWHIWFFGRKERELGIERRFQEVEKRPPTPAELEYARLPGIVIHAIERPDVTRGRFRPLSLVFTGDGSRHVITLSVSEVGRTEDGSRPIYHGHACLTEAYFDEVFRTSAGSVTLVGDVGEMGVWQVDWTKK